MSESGDGPTEEAQPIRPVKIVQIGMAEERDEALPVQPVLSTPTQWIYDGFVQAFERFQAAEEKQDGREAFFPLAETLNWAVSLRDRLAKDCRPVHHRLVSALGFARNRVHHDWAAALVYGEIPAAEAGLGELPGNVTEWLWRPLEELPQTRPHKRAGEAYVELLVGKPVRSTLNDLRALFLREL